MILSFVFWLLFGFYSHVESSGIWHNTRIVGGKPANITEFPYQLSMEDAEGHVFCGATVIARSWAISAAHCVLGFNESDIILRSGSSKRSRGGNLHTVDRIIVHPDYNDTIEDNDICLLQVSVPFNYSDVLQKVEMARETPAVGSTAVVSGYGQLMYQGELPVILQKVKINILDHERCEQNYLNNTITPNMLCAGMPEGGKDACAGDSGGPLVVNKTLVGIVSWGEHCAEKGHPGVYTDVAKVRKWIVSHTGEE